MMRPAIPSWLEEICNRLTENDPKLTTVEITHQRIDDVGARVLSTALQENTSVTVFILSCFSMVDDGAHSIGSVISRNHTIQKLQLRELRSSRELKTFFHALTKNTAIEELSLRHSHICPHSASSLCELLWKHPSLREFRLVDTQIPGLFLICEGLACNQTLQRLYLVNNEMDKAGANDLSRMIKKNQSLRELFVCQNYMGNEGIAVLVQGMNVNTSIHKLDLRSNDIGVQGALALQQLIETSPSLQYLWLGSNDLGNVGLEALCHGLKHNCVLQSLDVSDNNIDAVGAKSLACTLRKNATLQEVNLSFNDIGDEGATAIADVLEHNTSLTMLFLRRNNIGNRGAVAFAKKLPNMRGLKELVITKNFIDKEGAAYLLEGLRFNMELEYLHVDDKISEPISREIVHWIRLNQAGRRIFRQTNLPDTIWPLVLYRIKGDIDALFYFLCEKPEVFVR